MIHLFLAILCSFLISICIKLNEMKGAERQVVLASNYIVGTSLCLIIIMMNGNSTVSLTTIILGLVGGFLWPYTFYILMWGIREFGLSLTGAFCRLSLVVPVLFALIFLKEKLTVYTCTGIAAVFTAFIMLQPSGSKDGKFNWKALWFFPLLVFSFGMADVWVNVFNTYCPESEKFHFIFFVFFFSAIFTWALVLMQKIRPDRNSFMRGIVLGFPNVLSTVFILSALMSPVFHERSAIVYSLYSIVGVMLAFTAGAVLWKEKVTNYNIAGVAAAVMAIILLNIR